ncbi:MAG TPA: hypothetical protein VF963_01070 [Gaiellaceae bacterium]
MTTASICGPTCGTPLFLHVLGAMSLFGDVATVTILAYAALRKPEFAAILRRLAFTVTLLGIWPSFIAMRIGAQWVARHEGLANSNATWIGIGFGISDGGVIVLALITVVAWLALRRPRAGPYLAGLATLYLIALGVAWFAMSAKPGS